MADATRRGKFVWHELMTPNSAGAHEFYGKVLGWKKQPWEQDPSYAMFAAKSGPVGGAMERKEQTPHWLPYVGTTNVDDSVATAEAHGARVLSPAEDLPNGGRHAVLADPQGAVFGIYSSSAEAEPDRAPQPGEFSWHELATNADPSAVFPFYADLFAWDEITQHDMGPMGMYLIFGRDGRQLGGIFNHGKQGKAGHAYWLAYVSVDDLEGTVERAKAERGSVLMGPMDVPGGDRIAQLMDPQGAFFALHMHVAAAKATPAATTRATARKRSKKTAALKKTAAAKKPTAKQRPAKKRPAKKAKTAAKKITKKAAKKAVKKTAKKSAARKAANQKPAARRPISRKTAKKARSKAKTRRR